MLRPARATAEESSSRLPVLSPTMTRTIFEAGFNYCALVSRLLISDDQFAGNDGTGAGQEPHRRAKPDRHQRHRIRTEFYNIGGAPWRQRFPENQFERLRERHGPYGTVKIAPLGALAFRRRPHARQNAECAEQQDHAVEGEV